MLYAILCEDHPGSLERRKSARQAHLARLEALQEQGRLVLAGPYPAIDCDDPGEAGFTGSLIVAEFPSLEEATRWVEDDPYRHIGAYARVTVKPFRKVFPR